MMSVNNNKSRKMTNNYHLVYLLDNLIKINMKSFELNIKIARKFFSK